LGVLAERKVVPGGGDKQTYRAGGEGERGENPGGKKKIAKS